MAYLRTDGIVTRVVNYGEADKIITIFSGDYGKLEAAARGARRPTSRLIAGSQFLCYGNYVLYKGNSLYSVNTCDVIEPFYGIRTDLSKLTYASHIIDIINDVAQENQPLPGVMRLLLNTLHMLINSKKPPGLITAIFQLRLLCLIGYTPNVYGCLKCGKALTEGGSFDFINSGIVCPDCLSGKGQPFLVPGAVKAMQHIVYSSMEDLFRFDLSAEALHGLAEVVAEYTGEKMEKQYNKLDYLKTINSF